MIIFMAFTHFRTQGFFLKQEDRGEADQIFSAFTKDFGRVEVVGKSIRKIKSKLRSGAQMFYLSEIEFIQGKRFKTLTDTISINIFPAIRHDLNRLTIAWQIADVFDKLIRGQEPDNNIWKLLQEVFLVLNHWKLEIENCKLKILHCYFTWNLLSLLGYTPELYNCAICEKKLLPETMGFSSHEGGAVCWQCIKKTGDKPIAIDPAAIKVIRLVLRNDWRLAARLNINKELQSTLESISDDYLNSIN